MLYYNFYGRCKLTIFGLHIFYKSKIPYYYQSLLTILSAILILILTWISWFWGIKYLGFIFKTKETCLFIEYSGLSNSFDTKYKNTWFSLGYVKVCVWSDMQKHTFKQQLNMHLVLSKVLGKRHLCQRL